MEIRLDAENGDGREEKDSSREKDELRRRIKALRREVSPSEKALWDRRLKENFFRLFDRQPARDLCGPVYLYLDFRNEAGTREIFSEI